MEQAWTFDKYDVPRGDLEFWATRRGILDGPANRRARSVAVGRRTTIARVTLIVEERPNAVLIPETALMPMGRDVFAFRVVDGKVVQTRLRTGLRRGGEVEILEGLKAGDSIVAEGIQKVRDGQFVRESKLAAGS